MVGGVVGGVGMMVVLAAPSEFLLPGDSAPGVVVVLSRFRTTRSGWCSRRRRRDVELVARVVLEILRRRLSRNA